MMERRVYLKLVDGHNLRIAACSLVEGRQLVCSPEPESILGLATCTMLGIGSPNSALDASDSRNWVRDMARLEPSPSYVWWSCRYPYDPSGRYRLSVTGRLLGWRGDVTAVTAAPSSPV